MALTTEYGVKIVVVIHSNDSETLEECIESIKAAASELSVSKYIEKRSRCPVREDEKVDRSQNVI